MISSIRNCISISFNHLVIHAQKLNLLTLRIKEYVIHKFKSTADCFKDIYFLRNKRVNSSNQTCTIQNNNRNLHQVATATLNPAISASQQPPIVSNLTTELAPNRAEDQFPTTNSESIYSTVNNQLLTLDKLDQALEEWENDPNAIGQKSEASQRIRKAFRNKSIDLDLSSLQLNNLPNIIGHLTQLQTLNLAYNKLEFLPAEIVNLTQLKELNLSNNQLQELPAEIGNLIQLQTLYLYKNKLQALPAAIGNLTQLKTLYLTYS